MKKNRLVNIFNRAKGSSLVEVILIIIVVGSITFLIGNIPSAIGLMTKSSHLSLAREIASKQVEDERSLGYANLVIGTNTISDSRISLLSGGSGTVTVEDCDSQTCPNGEHLKKVTVTITWKDLGKSQTATITTLIGEGGINK